MTNTNIIPPYVKLLKETTNTGYRYFTALLEVPPSIRTVTYNSDYRDMNYHERQELLKKLKQKYPTITESHNEFIKHIIPSSFKLAFPYIHIFLTFYKGVNSSFNPRNAYVLFSQKAINSLEEVCNNPTKYHKSNFSAPAPLPNVYSNSGEFCFDKHKQHEPFKSLTEAINYFLTLFFNAAFNPDTVPAISTPSQPSLDYSLQALYPNLYPFTKWEKLSKEDPNFIINQLPELLTEPPSYKNLDVNINHYVRNFNLAENKKTQLYYAAT